jgi:hypothetical protein
MRQHAMAKLSAITFVVLILLPFTAPFPTYHPDHGHDRPHEALPKEIKNKLDGDGSLALPSDCRLLLPAWFAITVRPSNCLNQFSDHPVRHSVLRL